MAAKVFEVGDVLPATTQLRISWGNIDNILIDNYEIKSIKSDNNTFPIVDFGRINDIKVLNVNEIELLNNHKWKSPYTNYGGNHAYIDIDTSSWSLSKRTVTKRDYELNIFSWEDLNAPQGFSVSFEENGGTSVTDLTEQTNLPSPLPTPTKSGYVFGGWYYDSAFTQKANAGDTIASNVTLYAKWQLNSYTITYNTNGGSSVPQTSNATQLPNPLPIPTKSGYIFAGWYYDSAFTNRAFAGDPLTGNVTLYAKWQLNSYTITYNSNGGSSIPQTSNVAQLPNPLPIPTRSGYIFVNWYYDSALTQIASPGAPIESNVTLYAGWRTTMQTSIRIYNGTNWFTLDGYSSYDCLNSLTYVNAPERTIGGTIPNLSSIPTFIVTTLFITYKLMPYQTYKDFINHINNKVEFVIEYFDVDTGLMKTKKFYLAPQSQRELFYARRGGVRSIYGILNITLEFISTNNEV